MCCGCGGGSHKANCNFLGLLDTNDAKVIADNYWYTYRGSARIDQPYDCMDVDFYTYMINSNEVKLNRTNYETWRTEL